MSDADGAARTRSVARANALLDEVETLLRGANKIAAIKAYRTSTGCGLKDAKDTVEVIERTMGLPSQPMISPFGALIRAIRAWRGWR